MKYSCRSNQKQKSKTRNIKPGLFMYIILVLQNTHYYIIGTKCIYTRYLGEVIICFVFDSREIIDTHLPSNFPKFTLFQICRPPMGCWGVCRAYSTWVDGSDNDRSYSTSTHWYTRALITSSSSRNNLHHYRAILYRCIQVRISRVGTSTLVAKIKIDNYYYTATAPW